MIEYNPYENGIFSTIINQNSINSLNISLRDQNDILIDFNEVNYELSFLFEIHQKNIPVQEGGGGRRSEFLETPQIQTPQIQTPIPRQIQTPAQIPINQLGFVSQTKETPIVQIPIENNIEDKNLHDKQSHELQKKIIELELSVLDDIF